jgi:hypothetical protein
MFQSFSLWFMAFLPCLEVSTQRLYNCSSMLSSRILMALFFTFRASGIYWGGMVAFFPKWLASYPKNIQ